MVDSTETGPGVEGNRSRGRGAEHVEIYVGFLRWGNAFLIEGPVAIERCMWRDWVRRYVFNEKGFQTAW